MKELLNWRIQPLVVSFTFRVREADVRHNPGVLATGSSGKAIKACEACGSASFDVKRNGYGPLRSLSEKRYFSVKLCGSLCLCGEIKLGKPSPQRHGGYTENHGVLFPDILLPRARLVLASQTWGSRPSLYADVPLRGLKQEHYLCRYHAVKRLKVSALSGSFATLSSRQHPSSHERGTCLPDPLDRLPLDIPDCPLWKCTCVHRRSLESGASSSRCIRASVHEPCVSALRPANL